MVKIGIKALSLLAGAVFAMIVVVGCNPEEPAPPSTPTTPSKPGAAAPPSKPAAPAATPTKDAGKAKD